MIELELTLNKIFHKNSTPRVNSRCYISYRTFSKGDFMCCFVVPMAEAVVTTIATLVLQQTDKSKSESRHLEAAVSGAPQPFY